MLSVRAMSSVPLKCCSPGQCFLVVLDRATPILMVSDAKIADGVHRMDSCFDGALFYQLDQRGVRHED